MNRKTFIIEHLEPELWKWCIIEYKNISKTVGKNNLIFTNIKKDSKKLKKYGKVVSRSISELNLNDICVLDPESKKTLTPKEAQKYNYFIFGGILGDNPPRKRTEKELTQFIKNAKSYNIGKKQMSTDNAVAVVKEIVNGKKLKELKFKDKLEIRINKVESVILPYRYLIINNKPFISKELIDFIKKKKSF